MPYLLAAFVIIAVISFFTYIFPSDNLGNQEGVVTEALVRAMFVEHSSLLDDQIEMYYDNGLLTLEGSVDTPDEKRLVAELARSVPVVQEVVNNLVIGEAHAGTVKQFGREKRPEQQSVGASRDRQILAQATKLLRNNEHTRSLNIKPSVEDGILILHGHVNAELDPVEAELVVSKIHGVKEIRNLIEVR